MKRIIASILLVLAASTAALGYTSASKFLDKPDDWYKSDEAKRLAENVLSYQADRGGWPKNVDTAAQPYTGDKARLQGTFDNGATTFELRYLARMIGANPGNSR